MKKALLPGRISAEAGGSRRPAAARYFLTRWGSSPRLPRASFCGFSRSAGLSPWAQSRMVQVNVRIIVATNRNLEKDTASGKFRPDLYYRLNVFPIYMPPLRERGSDIILLSDFFVGKYAGQLKKNIKRISPSVIDLLLAYHWPGNVRELENCIERAALLADGDTIESVHLPPSVQMQVNAPRGKKQGTLASLVNTYERSLIIEALKDAGGNQSKAARLLGTTKRIIQYKVEKFGY